jgi:hypothetical protein
MSIHRSYFDKSNTLVYNSYTNTARNPVVELFFGRVDNILSPTGYSRYIFDIDLTLLEQKISSGMISTGCTDSLTHTLKMTNTSSFDTELLNTTMSNGRRRATSFDLILWRIPKTSGSTGDPQLWDSGVGYDYYNSAKALNSSNAMSVMTQLETDKSYSDRPSNWFQRTTVSGWTYNGVYDNSNSQTGATAGLNYSALTIVDVQHFEFGDEDISFDMTNEINDILTGSTTGSTGWGISYVPSLELITGMTENYSVGFFSPHTQTFYEPFLQTSYNDLIIDDRNTFYEKNDNNLYLYVYNNGNPINLDSNPDVDILDTNGEPLTGFTGLTTCLVTDGVYKVNISGLTATTVPCMLYDKWYNLSIDGVALSDIENDFVLKSQSLAYQIGGRTDNPKQYAFSFAGIKQNEKILSTDVRKVDVIVKQAYTTNVVLNDVQVFYRVYVKEGTTEVQVQDWTQVNKTPDSYYFVFDTRDKIPNEYFIDLKVNTDRNIDTYKNQINFQIVNRK